MWKNDRPEDWQTLIGIKYGAIPPRDAIMFEGGADAILKALRDTKSVLAIKGILWGKQEEEGK